MKFCVQACLHTYCAAFRPRVLVRVHMATGLQLHIAAMHRKHLLKHAGCTVSPDSMSVLDCACTRRVRCASAVSQFSCMRLRRQPFANAVCLAACATVTSQRYTINNISVIARYNATHEQRVVLCSQVRLSIEIKFQRAMSLKPCCSSVIAVRLSIHH
jgi:hypothetical protein